MYMRRVISLIEYIIVGSVSIKKHPISYKTRKCGPSGIRSDLIEEVTYTPDVWMQCTENEGEGDRERNREREYAARSFSGEIAEPRGQPSLKLISSLVRCVYPARQT